MNNHSEIEDYSSNEDVEKRINDENPTTSDITGAIHIINKFLSAHSVK